MKDNVYFNNVYFITYWGQGLIPTPLFHLVLFYFPCFLIHVHVCFICFIYAGFSNIASYLTWCSLSALYFPTAFLFPKFHSLRFPKKIPVFTGTCFPYFLPMPLLSYAPLCREGSPPTSLLPACCSPQTQPPGQVSRFCRTAAGNHSAHRPVGPLPAGTALTSGPRPLTLCPGRSNTSAQRLWGCISLLLMNKEKGCSGHSLHSPRQQHEEEEDAGMMASLTEFP